MSAFDEHVRASLQREYARIEEEARVLLACGYTVEELVCVVNIEDNGIGGKAPFGHIIPKSAIAAELREWEERREL